MHINRSSTFETEIFTVYFTDKHRPLADGNSLVLALVHQQSRLLVSYLQRRRDVRKRLPQPGLQRFGGFRVLSGCVTGCK